LQPTHGTRPEVLNEHISLTRQVAQNLLTGRLFHIYSDALLVSIDRQIVTTLSADIRWSPVPRIVAGTCTQRASCARGHALTGHFNLPHGSTKIAK
jgi:hypothetical protein